VFRCINQTNKELWVDAIDPSVQPGIPAGFLIGTNWLQEAIAQVDGALCGMAACACTIGWRL
jgi:hypothetical protein